MRLFSYKVTRDYGFAPNPFHGICTLAACKPKIRAAARIGDLVVGCGSTKNKLPGHVIFVLRVTHKYSFDEYWLDPEFAVKRPNFHSSPAHAYGDNIYHRRSDGSWVQERSHHSYQDGSINPLNLERDTGSTDAVLLSDDFVYFGNKAIKIPKRLRNYRGDDLYPNVRDVRSRYDEKLIAAVDKWFSGLPRGVVGRPINWS